MQRSARPKTLARISAGIAAVLTAAMFFGTGPSHALPAPRTDNTPGPSVATTPTPLPTGAHVLPVGSSVFFVLDGRISSKTSRTGDAVPAHLRNDLAIGGETVAKAGTPVVIKISDVHGAKAPDQDGSIDIYFEPVKLVNQATLPLHTPTSHLTVSVSAGEQTTAGITDQIKDIFIPGHMLFRMFRKGADVQLDTGTVVRARTAAIVDAGKPGAPLVITPPPITMSTDTPHSGFKPLPFYTTKPKVTMPPRVTPSPAPTASASPAATATP